MTALLLFGMLMVSPLIEPSVYRHLTVPEVPLGVVIVHSCIFPENVLVLQSPENVLLLQSPEKLLRSQFPKKLLRSQFPENVLLLQYPEKLLL